MKPSLVRLMAATLLGILSMLAPRVGLAHSDEPSTPSTWGWGRSGTVRVDNRSGTALDLAVDGRSVGQLQMGERRSLTMSVGAHRVIATYVQLGQVRVLEDNHVVVQPGRLSSVGLEPVESGLVRLSNQTGRDGSLRIDGISADRWGIDGRFLQGQTRELALPPGRHELSLVDSRAGFELDRTALTVVVYRDHSWCAEAARVGGVALTNNLPMPVRVELPGRADLVLAAGSSRTLSDLPLGRVIISFRRMEGEALPSRQVEVRPYEVARVSAPTPSTGIVVVDNDEGIVALVRVDGRMLSSLAPRSEQRLELRPGSHRVDLLDSRGRRLLTETVWVDLYAEARVGRQAPAVSCTMPRSEDEDHHHNGDRDEREAQASTHIRP